MTTSWDCFERACSKYTYHIIYSYLSISKWAYLFNLVTSLAIPWYPPVILPRHALILVFDLTERQSFEERRAPKDWPPKCFKETYKYGSSWCMFDFFFVTLKKLNQTVKSFGGAEKAGMAGSSPKTCPHHCIDGQQDWPASQPPGPCGANRMFSTSRV